MFRLHSKRGFRFLGCLVLCLLGVPRILALEVGDAKAKFLKGDYEDCIRLCEKAVADNEPGEDFRLLLAEALTLTGRHREAVSTVTNAMSRYSRSLRLRMLALDVFQRAGLDPRREEILKEIDELGRTRMWAYRNPADMVALGRAALAMGADPKLVLENLFEQAKRSDPSQREPYLAVAELALGKHDAELAARSASEGLQKFQKDPDLLCLLARAHTVGGDRGEALKALEGALEANPHHVPSLLLKLDYEVDAEEYTDAEATIAALLKIDAGQPQALAYRAVLQHLNYDVPGEQAARAAALAVWQRNPEVDYLIGRKLSQKYRFKEGAQFQRQALEFDADYLPSRIQLSQDLLRLGLEEEGWQLAEAVHEHDGYDVTAFNLVTLKDSMDKFAALTNANFILRMEPRESAVYGTRALALLEQARTKLCPKYGVTLENRTVVEVFNKQSDFAVRTFGMPGNPGFLGVCFGDVITANSPVSQSSPVNWEAVLWHEFCHTVTLNLTRNRMPRWLSEGISVYEERQINAAWGQHMTPKYREMVLDGELTPIGKLSAAFLAPKTPLHLQFAYYQSSLVVEYLVGRYGVSALRGILESLRDGLEVNAAIEKHTAPLNQLEKEFAAHAKELAEALGPELDWTRPSRGRGQPDVTQLLPSKAGKNYWVQMDQAAEHIRAKEWKEAEEVLRRLTEAFPDQRGEDSGYALLALVYRNLADPAREKAALRRLAQLDAAVPAVYLRLMETAEKEADWEAVLQNAERYLAVNPMGSGPYGPLAQALEKLKRPADAVACYQTLLKLDPPDPAHAAWRVADLLHQAGDPAAKRYLLQSLEAAPRFREAQRLLLQMQAVGAVQP